MNRTIRRTTLCGAVSLCSALSAFSVASAADEGAGAAEDPHAHCKALAAPAAAAGDPHARHKAMAAQAAAEATAPTNTVDVKVLDAELLDQDGNRVHFRSDVIADRLVVMNFVYTTCTTICPILSAKFTRLQESLGGRQGREVFLVSMSIDPTRDTPPRLKAYAAKHKARAGWSHLTGKKDDVDQVLKGLGAYTTNFVDHAPMLLVGDGRTGRWARLNGFPTAEQVLAQIDELLAARRQAAKE